MASSSTSPNCKVSHCIVVSLFSNKLLKSDVGKCSETKKQIERETGQKRKCRLGSCLKMFPKKILPSLRKQSTIVSFNPVQSFMERNFSKCFLRIVIKNNSIKTYNKQGGRASCLSVSKAVKNKEFHEINISLNYKHITK